MFGTIKKKTDNLSNFEIKWYDEDKPLDLSSFIKKKKFKNQIKKKNLCTEKLYL